MKTIKNSKDITTLEVGDVVVFGNLKHEVVCSGTFYNDYHLCNLEGVNDAIFERLNINKKDFVTRLGIAADYDCDFPEVKSLEALTAIVSALFKEHEKQNELPKTWEEFCEKNPLKKGECLISPFCQMHVTAGGSRDADEDRNYCISEREAQAFLALKQLRQLWKAYVKDWEPDWNCSLIKFCIIVDATKIRVTDSYFCQKNLSFPTQKLAEQFLTNFKDLLEIAKPLL